MNETGIEPRTLIIIAGCVLLYLLLGRAERVRAERRERIHDAFAQLADVFADSLDSK